MYLRFFLLTIFLLGITSVTFAETMSVSFSGADIRTAPSAAESKVVFTATRYYPLEVMAMEKEYYKVKDYRGRSGYIHKTLLKAEKSVVVTSGNANVRKGPGTTNEIVCQLTRGDGAKFLSKKDGWVEIKSAKGDHGWIADFLVWGE